MSKDDDKGGPGRLWSGSIRRNDAPKADNVLPMERQPDPRHAADRSYVAFDLRKKANRLEIRCAARPSRFPSYNYLLDISHDRFNQSAFSLIYTFMVVTVSGWNLESVVHAISYGDCERITEFSAREHDKPGKDAPLIESIELVTADEQITKAGRKS